MIVIAHTHGEGTLVHGTARGDGTNLVIKNVKRLGFGFRNFDNYRLRLLLRCGAPWQHRPVASIRRRTPRVSA